MAQNLTNANAALKEDYQPSIREQLNNDIEALNYFEKNSTDVEGRRAVLSLHTGRNSGVGARPEGGTLPTAGQQGYQEERVLLKYNYGRIQITGPVMKAMRSDQGSFVRALESEINGVVQDLKRDVNRQIFNNANGTIAQAASVSGQVVTMTSMTNTQKRQLFIGSKVDLGTVTNPTLRGTALVVTAVTDTTVTLTGTINASVDTSDYFTRSGAGSTVSGATYGLTGLQKIVNSGDTLFNVDGSTVAVWNSKVSANGGTNRAATDNLFETVIDDVWLDSGEAPDMFFTSVGVRRNYASQLKSQRRYDDSGDLAGGFKALTVQAGNTELAIHVDRDAPNNKAFLITSSCITQHQSSDWEFMDEDGAVLSRVSGEDAYEAVLLKYHELTTDRRNVHARVDDLSES